MRFTKKSMMTVDHWRREMWCGDPGGLDKGRSSGDFFFEQFFKTPSGHGRHTMGSEPLFSTRYWLDGLDGKFTMIPALAFSAK